MLKPSMQDLMKKVNNRYLLVNLAAQRARDISAQEEDGSVKLEEKPIKMALDEICDGTIEYRPGPKPEPVVDILEAASEMDDSEEEEDLVSIDESGEAAPESSDDITLEDL